MHGALEHPNSFGQMQAQRVRRRFDLPILVHNHFGVYDEIRGLHDAAGRRHVDRNVLDISAEMGFDHLMVFFIDLDLILVAIFFEGVIILFGDRDDLHIFE